eukprot:1917750-Prymnesium_polylepis.1
MPLVRGSRALAVRHDDLCLSQSAHRSPKRTLTPTGRTLPCRHIKHLQSVTVERARATSNRVQRGARAHYSVVPSVRVK